MENSREKDQVSSGQAPRFKLDPKYTLWEGEIQKGKPMSMTN